jgi:hypothetical protein
MDILNIICLIKTIYETKIPELLFCCMAKVQMQGHMNYTDCLNRLELTVQSATNYGPIYHS